MDVLDSFEAGNGSLIKQYAHVSDGFSILTYSAFVDTPAASKYLHLKDARSFNLKLHVYHQLILFTLEVIKLQMSDYFDVH